MLLRSSIATALAASSIVALPGAAGAASPPITRQATPAHAAFLANAPPPPGGAGAVCLVHP